MARIFGTQQIVGGGEGGEGGEKYSFTVRPGQKNTVLHFYRDGEKIKEKSHIIKIPYIKNLAVQSLQFAQAHQ